VQLDHFKHQRSAFVFEANEMEPQTSDDLVGTDLINGRADIIEQRKSLDPIDRIMLVDAEDHSLTSSLIYDEFSDTLPSCNIDEAKLQGKVFLEDAIQYRSIHHKANMFCLKLYRWFHSAPIRYCVRAATFLILILAFFEEPSSLSWSSDPRRHDTRYY